MFSIADLQQEQEQEDFEQEESEEEAEPSPSSFPIRCSISVTKVSAYMLLSPPFRLTRQ